MLLSMEEKAELAEVYEKAADKIQELGWYHPRQILTNSVGTVCFVLAIDRVAPGLSNLACKFAADALELPEGFSDSSRIYPWNDDPARTEDEVINTFHALANKLR